MEDNEDIDIPELPEIDKELLPKLSPYSRAFIELIERLKKEKQQK